jgi:hypothetical protein
VHNRRAGSKRASPVAATRSKQEQQMIVAARLMFSLVFTRRYSMARRLIASGDSDARSP